MKRTTRLLAALTAVLLIATMAPISAMAQEGEALPPIVSQLGQPNQALSLPAEGTYAKDRLLVKVAQPAQVRSRGTQPAVMELGDSALNIDPIFQLEAEPNSPLSSGQEVWAVVTLEPDSDMLAAAEQLSVMDNVLAVEFDHLVALSLPEPIEQSDPFEGLQTHLDFIKAGAAYNTKTLPGKDVVVAVLDSGLDINHPEFANQLVPGSRYYYVQNGFLTYSTNVQDGHGHGTHVSGIIAAARDGRGTTGIAPYAKLLPVKVLGDNGSGYVSAIAAGIVYASDRADIINLSLGGYGGSGVYNDACQQAREKGVLVVTASGNDALATSPEGSPYFTANSVPAGLTCTLGVMAMQETRYAYSDNLVYFSNWDSDPGEGAEYEIMAPGSNILSTYVDGTYARMSGTSMSAPMVTGAAAILISNGLTGDQAWGALVASGDKLQGKTSESNPNLKYTYSSLNIENALTFGTADPVLTAISQPVANPDMAVDPSRPALTTDLGEFLDIPAVIWASSSMESLIQVELTCRMANASNIKITGDLVKQLDEPFSMKVGQTKTINLELTDTKTPVHYISALINYTDELGVTQTSVPTELNLYAYNAALPDDLIWVDDPASDFGGHYILGKPVVKLNNTVYWCLPAPVHVEAGQTLLLEEGGMLYQSSLVNQTPLNPMDITPAVIYLNGGTFIAKGTAEAPALLLGNLGFHLQTDPVNGGKIDLDRCIVYDPDIDAVSTLPQSQNTITNSVLSNLNSALANNKIPYAAKATVITDTQIASLNNIDIRAVDFANNLQSACENATLTAQTIKNNTFNENFAFYQPASCLPLVVKTIDYDPDSGLGFFDNCVIGPAEVYTQQGDPAIISNNYYHSPGKQFTDSDGTHIIMPQNTLDGIWCANPNGYSTDKQAMRQLFQSCPPFILNQRLISQSYQSSRNRVQYRIGVDLSRSVVKTNNLFLTSPTNSLYLHGMYLPSQPSWSSDGSSFEATVYSLTGQMRDNNYYQFGGFSPANSSMQIARYQSSFLYPVAYKSLVNSISIRAKETENGAQISWGLPFGDFVAHCKITRQGKTLVTLYDGVASGLPLSTGGRVNYVDNSALEVDTNYRYQVTLTDLSDNSVISQGSVDFIKTDSVIDLSFSETGVSLLNSDTKTVNIVSNKGFIANQLTVDLSYNSKYFTITDVTEQIFTLSGLPVGISKIDDNTVRVSIGASNRNANIKAGSTLLQITLKRTGEGAAQKLAVTASASRDGMALTVVPSPECIITTSNTATIDPTQPSPGEQTNPKQPSQPSTPSGPTGGGIVTADVPPPPPPSEPVPTRLSGNTVVQNPTVVKDETTAGVEMTYTEINQIINAAKNNNVDTVIIAPQNMDSCGNLWLTLPAFQIQRLSEDLNADLTIQTPLASVTLPKSFLAQITGNNDQLFKLIISANADNTLTITATFAGNPISTRAKIAIPVATGQNQNKLALWQKETSGDFVFEKSAVIDGAMTANLTLPATVYLKESALVFKDVAPDFWGTNSIDFVSARGIFGGVGNDEFAPNLAISRAMFITALHRLDGFSSASSAGFEDVSPADWFADAVNWAAQNNIASGDGKNFRPGAPLNREQLVTILYRYAAYIGADTQARTDLNSFNDGGTVSPWAQEAMQWAVATGLVQGDNNAINPTGSATRAQIATILTRFIQGLLK